jgi:hypothetical protein
MKRFHAAARGLPLVLCLALAACGGEDKPTDGTGTNTDGGTPGTPDGGGGGNNPPTYLALDTSGASCNPYPKGSGSLPNFAYDTLNNRVGYDSASTRLDLEFTLANIGAPSGPFKVVIFLYPDSANPCSAYPLMTYNYSSAIANGQATISYSQQLSQLAPAARPPPGTYTVGFVLDSGNAITETDENNNRRMFNVQVRL